MTFSPVHHLGAGVLAMAAAAAFGCGCSTSTPQVASAVPHGPRDAIVVVGHGKVRVKPDAARIQFGLEVTAATVTEATRLSADRMTALLNALKGAGVAENDLQTSNYSVHLERTEQPTPVPLPKPAPQGAATGPRRPPAQPEGVYRVTNTVEAVVRDVGRVGPVIDSATAAGANNIWGVAFILENTANAEADARAKAFADARQRADALARLATVRLGPVTSVSEVIGGGDASVFASGRMGSFDKATPVEAGQISYSDDIQVVFTIER